MIKNRPNRHVQHLVWCLTLLIIPIFSGCDVLFGDDDEEDLCTGEVVLTKRLHDSSVSPEKLGDPLRSCYSIALVEQIDLYMNMGTELDRSSVYIELAGPLLGTE